jgi:hypothetical protein
MPEYYGYIPRSQNRLDFSKMAEGLSGSFEKAKTGREERKALDEKLLTDTNKLMKEYDPGSNKTINDIAMAGANQGRDKMYEWNKQLKDGTIDRRQYTSKINNLKDNWNLLAFSSKELDERLMTSMERQSAKPDGTDGDASGYEAYHTNDVFKLKDLSNKSPYIDEDGNVYLASIGEDGKMDSADVVDVKSSYNTENLVDNKVRVAKAVQDGVKNWGDVSVWKDLGGGATSTTEDVRQNKEAFNAAKYDLIESIMDVNNPRSVASVLVDNSNKGYEYYKTDAEKNSIIKGKLDRAAGIKGSALTEEETAKATADAESKLILSSRSVNGTWSPVITDAMIEDARETISNQIEIQLGYSIKGTPEYKEPAPRGGGSGDDEETPKQKEAKTKENQELIAGYKAAVRAFGFTPESIKANPDDSKSWSRVENDFGGLRGGFMYVKEKGTGYIIVKDSTGKKTLFTAKSPKQLAQYIYGGQNAAAAALKFDKARSMYIGGGSGTPKTSAKINTSEYN